MLTLQETGWTLNLFKIFSNLNILPIQVDVKSGKIQRQSSKIKVFIWKILFGVGVSHWLYIFGRLYQSTILEKNPSEKYFRWDHFVIHFGSVCSYAVYYFTGFCLFVKTPEENVIIFNQLFSEREDPVQKMVDRQLQIQKKMEPGNTNQVNKARAKSATLLVSASAREPNGSSQNEVIGNQSQLEFVSEVRPRPLLTWPRQYSLDELLAKLLPLIAVFTGFFDILFLAIDPTRPQLLYSVLPPQWQNPWSFLILLTVETLCLAVVLFTCSFSVVTQVLFFGKCQLEFNRINLQLRNLQEKIQNGAFGVRHTEKETWILRQISKEMKELAVLIEFFNRCFPFPIFASKICCLSLCITMYFFVIRHFQNFPLLAIFIGYGAITITFMYTIMYEHAFSIPGKMEELKHQFLVTAQQITSNSNGNKNVKAEMKREMKRIRGVGIKVGNFHQMERESTPNFVDFVVNQVVSLLVTFPG